MIVPKVLPDFSTDYCSNCAGYFPADHFPCSPDPLFAEWKHGEDD